MLTITPVDDVCFRIEVYKNGEKGTNLPPTSQSSEETRRQYLSQMRTIRREYPGLSALEFENLFLISIDKIIGWDIDKEKPHGELGVFGTPVAVCSVVEEQGRKVLHTHILIWLKGWDKLLDGRHHPAERTRKRNESTMLRLSSKIMSTRIQGSDENKINRPCKRSCPRFKKSIADMVHLQDQDVRNLRYKQGQTKLGGKTILHCNACNTSYTTEDLAIQRSIEMFGEDKISIENVRPTYNYNFWGENLCPSTTMMNMDLEFINHMLFSRNLQMSSKMKQDMENKIDMCTAISKNMHRSEHARKCFKQKQGECRMKIPQPMQKKHTVVHYSQECP